MLKPSTQQYTDEADLLAAVKKWLEPQERDGIKVIRVVDKYTKGYSDLFINAKGNFVVAELKDNIGTASPHQEEFIKEMIAAGGVGGVCRSVKDVDDLIQQAVYCRCTCKSTIGKYCPHCGKLRR